VNESEKLEKLKVKKGGVPPFFSWREWRGKIANEGGQKGCIISL
jgi:hypothetical protein